MNFYSKILADAPLDQEVVVDTQGWGPAWLTWLPALWPLHLHSTPNS
jgi:hypothetical protein